ncbi:Dna-Directed Rna polymerase I Subunit Rpa1 [Manis pentadactyla]|nr:Dna-Directed Rna polymerase I Subunit Rpa1 [Manis pentadactyla]
MPKMLGPDSLGSSQQAEAFSFHLAGIHDGTKLNQQVLQTESKVLICPERWALIPQMTLSSKGPLQDAVSSGAHEGRSLG